MYVYRIGDMIIRKFSSNKELEEWYFKETGRRLPARKKHIVKEHEKNTNTYNLWDWYNTIESLPEWAVELHGNKLIPIPEIEAGIIKREMNKRMNKRQKKEFTSVNTTNQKTFNANSLLLE